MPDTEWTYAWGWSNLASKPIDPMSEEEAAKCHESGELYTAIGTFSDGTVQYIHMRFEVDFAQVNWTDDFDRDCLVYTFER